MIDPHSVRAANAEVVPVPGRELVRWQPAELERPASRPSARSRFRWPSLRTWAITLAVLAGLAAAAGLVWLVVLAVLEVIAMVTAAIAWISAHWWLLIVVAVVLVFLAAGGRPRCPGLHCGGCRG